MTTDDKLLIIRRIVEKHQYEEVEGTILDVQTASLLLGVYNRLRKEINKTKFLSLQWEDMVTLAWKLQKGHMQ